MALCDYQIKTKTDINIDIVILHLYFVVVGVVFMIQIVLPPYLENVRDKLAENIHELWGMNKIELGWMYGKVGKHFSGL